MRGAPPLRCAVGYATALHDITHIVLSYSRDDDRVAGRALSKFVGMPNKRFLLTLAEHFEREGPKSHSESREGAARGVSQDMRAACAEGNEGRALRRRQG